MYKVYLSDNNKNVFTKTFNSPYLFKKFMRKLKYSTSVNFLFYRYQDI